MTSEETPPPTDTNSTVTLRRSALFLCVLPTLFPPLLIFLFAVDIPFWDDWFLAPQIDALYSGTLSLGDLFSQHNEHRLFFPRIVMLVLGHLTNFNPVINMYFSWTVSLATAFVLYLLFRRFFSETSPVYFLPIPWLLFSWKAYENILWGWQIQIYIFHFALVGMVYFLYRTPDSNRSFYLALGGAVLASFSFLSGLLTWFLGGMYMALRPGDFDRRRWVWWGGTALVVISLYFFSWTPKEGSPSMFYAFSHPGVAVKAFFACLGSVFASKLNSAVILGFIAVSLFLVVPFLAYREGLLPRLAPWLVLMAFALLNGVLVALGRSPYGATQGLNSRYVTLTTTGYIGLYFCLVEMARHLCEKQNQFRHLHRAFVAFVALGLLFAYHNGYQQASKLRESRLQSINIFRHYRYMPDSILKWTHMKKKKLIPRIKVFEKYRLNLFQKPRLDIPTLEKAKGDVDYRINLVGNMDPHLTPREKVVVNDGQRFVPVYGYAVILKPRQLPGEVYLLLDGEHFIPSVTRITQPLLAVSKKDSLYHLSGFYSYLPGHLLTAGPHTLEVRLVSKDLKRCYHGSLKITFTVSRK